MFNVEKILTILTFQQFETFLRTKAFLLRFQAKFAKKLIE